MTAGPFAPAVRNGRALTWESLGQTQTPVDLPGQFVNNAFDAGIFRIRYAVLLPQNVTRGVVTLVRLRGSLVVYFPVADISQGTGPQSTFMETNIQLVPIANGVIQDEMILNPLNAADLESNRIIWRQNYTMEARADGALIASQRFYSQHEKTEVDVKSKRRFDRALFALVIVVAYPIIDETSIRVGMGWRGLFLAADGL